MEIDLSYLYQGLVDTVELYKKGENVFDMGNGPMFPSLTSQAKWQYASYPDGIYLSDGNNVYAFKAPQGLSEEGTSAIERLEGISPSKFGVGASKKGLAQVHRSDPGSIYFTMQEGTKNPTYTFKHVGGPKWQAIPKKKVKKNKPSAALPAGIPPSVLLSNPAILQAAIKEGMLKEGGVKDFFKLLDINAGRAMSNVPIALSEAGRLAGKHPLGAAATGLALGGLYDIGRRNLYNTPEENERENLAQRALRWIVPAAGLGAGGFLYSSLFPQGGYKRSFWPMLWKNPQYDKPGSLESVDTLNRRGTYNDLPRTETSDLISRTA